MNKKIVFLTALSIMLTGCGFSFDKPSKNIEVIEDVQALHDICVYQKSGSSYNAAEKLISAKLDLLNISYKVTSEDQFDNCPYTLSYDIRRAIGIPTYLAKMDVLVGDNESNLVGSVQYYYYLKGGLTMMSATSLRSTDSTINELLDEMFSNK